MKDARLFCCGAKLKAASYVDEDGRKWRTWLPDHEDDSNAAIGIPAGPPSLAGLQLPLDVEVRLHNELFNRGLFAEDDLRRHREDLQAALRAALRLDVERVWALYHDVDNKPQEVTSNGRRPNDPQEQSEPSIHDRRRLRPRR